MVKGYEGMTHGEQSDWTCWKALEQECHCGVGLLDGFPAAIALARKLL